MRLYRDFDRNPAAPGWYPAFHIDFDGDPDDGVPDKYIATAFWDGERWSRDIDAYLDVSYEEEWQANVMAGRIVFGEDTMWKDLWIEMETIRKIGWRLGDIADLPSDLADRKRARKVLDKFLADLAADSRLIQPQVDYETKADGTLIATIRMFR